ncbi:MAG: response regulator [Aphanothece sp. CMT-3BRIN-NPC111]|jgi:twitching motility two-component system response regulator PilH|nr:response regulator [Aphanothece sp. CMT-3BRIN-NPC111]
MKTVLVVEDSRAQQRLIVALLQQVGLKVALADSAESALKWLEDNGQPDLIVLDIIMPGLSGLDLCRQLRANPQLKNVPIVFCSSKAQDFDQFWALRQGGNAYITKPFDPSDLVSTVCEHLN